MRKNQYIEKASIRLSELPKTDIRVIFDGEKLQTARDFIETFAEKLSFPDNCHHDNIDAFLDWIRDLTWFDFNSIDIIIKNRSKLLALDQEFREYVPYMFKEIILPFWEEEVIRVVVEGEPKEFTVYIVDEVI